MEKETIISQWKRNYNMSNGKETILSQMEKKLY